MSSITYMHGRTPSYDELRRTEAQRIDAVIDLWIAGKGPAPELVSDPDYIGPDHMPNDPFAGITRAAYDAYVSRVKVSRTGVVTAVKVRKTAARKPAAKCCPHCGGTL